MSCRETSASGSGRTIRRAAARCVGVAVVVCSSVFTPASIAVASAPLTPAEKAAQEIQAARDRADAAAQALFDTEAEIDRLDLAIADTEDELVEIEAELASARSGLEQQAVRQFVGAGGPTMPLLIDIGDSNDVLAAEVYSSVATQTVFIDLDDYDALMTEVGEKRDDLEEQQADADAASLTFAAQQEQAEAEVILLGEIEEQRLADEAVQRALEAERQARAEQERRAQEAAAEQAAAEQAAADARAAAATPAQPPTPSGQTPATPASGASQASADPAPENTAEPAAPAQVTPEVAPQPSGSNLACPVAGPRAFADTWGAARSGGRSHQGVDVISPSGTPLVAMEAGRVEYRSNALGGQTLRLYGASGTRYYYAHLSRYEGGNRTVNQGDVVGYVGRTGNTTTNHLHLQIHPGGGQPINPYPITRAACG
ncbi:MAG: peptidoglycan DD-metalloendopeptidase family protein [Ilumatobacter sp.]|uniref:peptidoglycan DD-metalloendopeptidase family protein n=1 Tax=Ilumatobacter sp. TaxID=1967498 RepID=UPI00329784DB